MAASPVSGEDLFFGSRGTLIAGSSHDGRCEGLSGAAFTRAHIPSVVYPEASFKPNVSLRCPLEYHGLGGQDRHI